MIRKALALMIALIGFQLLFFTPILSSLEWTIAGFGTLWFWGIIFIAQISLAVAFWPQTEEKLPRRFQIALGFSAVALFSATFALFRASELDQLILAALSLGSSLLSVYFYALTHDHFGAVSEILLAPLQLGLSWLGEAIPMVFEYPMVFFEKISQHNIWGKLQSRTSTKYNGALLRGTIITVPIVLVLLFLLATADPIFGHMLLKIFDVHVSAPEVLSGIAVRLIVSLVFVVIVLPVFLLAIKPRYHSPFAQDVWKNYNIEVMMAVGAVALVLGVFLTVQFKYVFATVSETELHQFGVQTYSEYVRKGFSELLLVGVLVYGVASAGVIVLRQLDTQKQKILAAFNTLLIAEGLFFLFSVARRVFLYQATHGFSRSRIYGLTLLLILAVLFITLLMRVYVRQKLSWYLIEFSLVAAILLVTIAADPDKLIATQYKPTVNNEIDYVYIARLSPAAVIGWVEAFDHAKEILNDPKYTSDYEYTENDARQILYADLIVNSLMVNTSPFIPQTPEKSESWKYYNVAHADAKQIVNKEIPFEDFGVLHERARALRTFLEQKKLNNIQLDRSYDSPLLD